MVSPDLQQESIWLKQIRASNRIAYTHFYNHYRNRLQLYILPFVKSQAQAEEIVQDTFLKLWEKRENLDENHSLRAYTKAIAKRRVLNLLKRTQINEKFLRHKRYTSSLAQECNTEDQLLLAEYQHITQSAVERLPRQQKLIYSLSREQELTYGQIAAQLHISVSAVEKHMSKALQYVKKQVQTKLGIVIRICLLLWWQRL